MSRVPLGGVDYENRPYTKAGSTWPTRNSLSLPEAQTQACVDTNDSRFKLLSRYEWQVGTKAAKSHVHLVKILGQTDEYIRVQAVATYMLKRQESAALA